MTALEMLMEITDEELERQFPDYSMIDAMDVAIDVLSGEEPEGNTSKAAKRLIDLRDNLQSPEDYEIEAMNTAIIALIKAA